MNPRTIASVDWAYRRCLFVVVLTPALVFVDWLCAYGALDSGASWETCGD
jgi:hypothetical protein